MEEELVLRAPEEPPIQELVGLRPPLHQLDKATILPRLRFSSISGDTDINVFSQSSFIVGIGCIAAREECGTVYLLFLIASIVAIVITRPISLSR